MAVSGFAVGLSADDWGAHGMFRNYLRRIGILSTGSATNVNLGGGITTNGDLEMGNTPFSIDGGTSGLALDVENDGVNDLVINSSMILTLGASTASPAMQLADTDVVHGVTAIAATNVYTRMSINSGNDGGTFFTGFSDGAATGGMMIRGVNVADPTDTTPSVQIRGAVASGTGLADPAAAETVFQVSDATGADDFLTIVGSGDATFNADITSSDTDDLGWSIVDQTDNQACNTGCTNACVFGIQNASGVAVTNLVSCTDTTADLCACAGSS